MPPVIAAATGSIALAAFSAGAPMVVANAIVGVGVAGAVLSTTVSTAIAIGASYAIAKLTAPALPKPSNGQIEFKQAIPPRFFTYGGMRTSGPVLLLEKFTPGILFKITAFGTRPISSIQKFYLDGNETALDGSGNIPIGAYRVAGADHGFLHTHLGAEDQLADSELDDWPGWSANHRLRGIPYAYQQMWSGLAANFQEAFPHSDPTPEIVAGVNVYDPRRDPSHPAYGGSGAQDPDDPSTWEYSDNQRLCVLDWLHWPEGYNKPWDRFDWATWIPQINLADQNVTLAAGGTEKRYRVATRVGYDEPRSRVLHRLLQAGDQQLFVTASGLIGSRGGVWQAPTVSLPVEKFPEAFFTHGIGQMERVNEFQLSCMLPQRDYVEFELADWVNAADPEHAAGIIRRAPLELTQVPSNGQAQRLAKIYMSKRNPAWNGQVRTSFAGLNAIGEAAVNLSFDELDQPPGTFNGPFWVNGKIAFLPDKTGVTFPVASADPAAYDWDEETEEQDIPALPTDTAMLRELRREAA